MIKTYVIKETFNNEDEDFDVVYIGNTNEIKATWKSICRNQHTWLYPMFADMPIFSDRKEIYGIGIWNNVMYVLNSDTIAEMFFNGILKEVK